MSPPFFADIGKKQRDILTTGYHLGLIKLDCKANTEHGITLSAGGAYTIESKKLGAYVGAKGNTDSFGLGIKWNADVVNDDGYMKGNLITGEASAKDQYLQLTTDCTADVDTGFTVGHIKNAFKDDHVAFNMDTEVKKEGPFMIEAAVALEYEGLTGGLQLAYDAQGQQLVKDTIAVEFTHADATIGAKVENEKIFGIFGAYKFSDKFDAGADIAWNNEESAASGTVGCRYEWADYHSTIRTKINSDIGLGLSIAHRFKDHITITLSGLLDCKNLTNEPQHKIGLAVEVEL